MKQITKERWGRFGWLCMSFVPMAGYLTLMFVATFACMFMISIGSILRGALDYDEMLLELMQWSMHISLVAAVLGLIAFGLWYYFGCKRKQLQPPMDAFEPGLVAALIMVAFGGQFMASYLVGGISMISPDIVEGYAEMMELAGMGEVNLITVLYVVLLGPITEEVIFRGVTFFYARRATKRFWLANVIQAAAFGMMHMNLVQSFYAFFVGLVLGWVYERFHSMYACMLMHILFNLLGTLVLGQVESLFADIAPLMVLWHIVGTASFVAGMLLLRRRDEQEVDGSEQR